MNRFLCFHLAKNTKPRTAKEIIKYQKYLQEKYSSLKNFDSSRSILAKSILLFRCYVRSSIHIYIEHERESLYYATAATAVKTTSCNWEM